MNEFRTRGKVLGAGFGLDFGSKSLKIVYLNLGAEGTTLRSAGILPMPFGSLKDGALIEKQKVSSLIKRFCKSQGIKPLVGRFSIPVQRSTVRWLELPPLDPHDLQDAASFQARKHLSYPVEDAYVSLTPLHAGSTNPSKLPYLLIATPREVVDSRADALEMAGIEPVHATLDPFAIIRALHEFVSEKGLFWRDQSLTFMEMGDHSTEMYVVRDLELRFMRSIPVGSGRLSKAIAEALKIEYIEADLIKQDAKTRLQMDGKIAMSLDNQNVEVDIAAELERLTKEIRRLIKYYRSLFPERSYAGILDRVYLCGGMASLKGLDSYLSQTLNVYVQSMNPFSRVAATFKHGALQSVIQHESAFVIAMGLATDDLMASVEPEGMKQDERSEWTWSRIA